jgi:hypothetical protein
MTKTRTYIGLEDLNVAIIESWTTFQFPSHRKLDEGLTDNSLVFFSIELFVNYDELDQT